MRSIIKQSVNLPAPSAALYAMYLDPATHAAITGAPVTIASRSGAPFGAFDGRLRGTMLAAVEPALIVQSWRSVHFGDADPETFTPAGEAGRIDLVHLDVPEQDYQGVTEGWEKFYWTPWRQYLAKR